MKEKKGNSKDLEKPDLKKTKVKSKPTVKKADLSVWSFEDPVPSIRKGQKLRIETRVPAVVHWTNDEWETSEDTPTIENRQSKHFADLTEKGRNRKTILFTFYWPDAQRWENRNFEVYIIGS